MLQRLLLTGATGQVGRYLVRDLLLKGQPLAVLLRPRGDQTAGDRLDGVLGYWERELGRPLPRPVCLEGDVALPGLGLDAATRRWVARHCDALLHNAASLTFVGADRDKDPWLTNLTGTAHVLDGLRAQRRGRRGEEALRGRSQLPRLCAELRDATQHAASASSMLALVAAMA